MFQHIGLFCSCEGKYCKGCQQVKCSKAFGKNVQSRDGLRHRCKDCDNTYQRSLYSKQHGDSKLAYRGSNVDQYVSGWSFQHIGLLCSCRGKYCNGCQQVKCYKAFGKDGRNKDGLRYQCMECVNKWSEQNRDTRKDAVREYNQEYYHKNHERFKERGRTYRETNRDKVREDWKLWAKNHPENIAAHRRKDMETHKEQRNINAAKRRARKAQATGSHTVEEWKDLCAYYKYTCLCCGRREPEICLSPDHVVPLARGGTNSIDNIQPLCRRCNQSKHARTIDYRP